MSDRPAAATAHGDAVGPADPDTDPDPPRPEYGETWVFESLVGAVPGLELSPARAVLVQFALFEAGVLVLAFRYGLPAAAVAGTVAVAVAATGSAVMLDLGARIRAVPTPAAYRRLLFGSSVEVALGLVAFAGLVTFLFVVDPRGGEPIVERYLGPRPPAPAAFLALLILWDVCYRIATAWWASVAACYRSLRFDFDPETVAELRRVDRRTAGYAAVQLALVPLVLDEPWLAAAVVGHVAATLAVVGASLWLLRETDRVTSA